MINKSTFQAFLKSDGVALYKRIFSWVAVIGIPIDLMLQGTIYPFDTFRILTFIIFGSYLLGIQTEGSSDYKAIENREISFKMVRFAMFLSVVAILVSTLHLMNGVKMAGAIGLILTLALFEF